MKNIVFVFVSILFAGMGSVFGYFSYVGIPDTFEMTKEYANAHDVAAQHAYAAFLFFALSLIVMLVYAFREVRAAFL